MNEFQTANRNMWNQWAKEHVNTDLYDLVGFKAGATSLRHIEIEELGSVEGDRLLHLQCHFGLDTLSLARRGAKVTGVDFSDEAVGLAQSLSAELSIPARFLCHELMTLPQHLDERFDTVFTSYGAICWLSDLTAWARLIADFLEPGGRFYMVEFHPMVYSLGQEAQLEYPYFAGKEPWRDEDASYANPDGPKQVNFTWSHHLGEVVTALLDAGLHLSFLHEFPYSTYGCFDFVTETAPQRYEIKEEFAHKMPKRGLPMTFSLMAHKPA